MKIFFISFLLLITQLVSAKPIPLSCMEPADCYRYGEMYFSQKGAKNAENAVNLYIKGCDLGHAKSCAKLATIANMAKRGSIFKFYADKTCRLNDGESCAQLGDYLITQGKQKKALRYFNDAFQVLSVGCDNNDGKSCTLVGLMYFEALYVDKNLYLAGTYFEKGCDLNDGLGCVALGQFSVNDGLGLGSQRKSLPALERGCKLGVNRGCFLAAMAYAKGDMVDQSYTKSNNFAKKGCDLKDGVSCLLLGYHNLNGLGVKKSNRKAREYFKKSCDMGDQVGCEEYMKINKSGGNSGSQMAKKNKSIDSDVNKANSEIIDYFLEYSDSLRRDRKKERIRGSR